jgi:hypothetical protein
MCDQMLLHAVNQSMGLEVTSLLCGIPTAVPVCACTNAVRGTLGWA